MSSTSYWHFPCMPIGALSPNLEVNLTTIYHWMISALRVDEGYIFKSQRLKWLNGQEHYYHNCDKNWMTTKAELIIDNDN
jgi:hypothetical protein